MERKRIWNAYKCGVIHTEKQCKLRWTLNFRRSCLWKKHTPLERHCKIKIEKLLKVERGICSSWLWMWALTEALHSQQVTKHSALKCFFFFFSSSPFIWIFFNHIKIISISTFQLCFWTIPFNPCFPHSLPLFFFSLLSFMV